MKARPHTATVRLSAAEARWILAALDHAVTAHPDGLTGSHEQLEALMARIEPLTHN